MYRNKYDLPPYACALIRRRARRLAHCLGGGAEDVRDFEQELTFRLWLSNPKFDPKKAHINAWVTTVVDRQVAKLLRERRAQKRSAGAVQTLDAPTSNGKSIEVPDHRGSDRDLERSDLRADLAGVLATLPADDRDLAGRLKVQTVSQTARDLKIPRANVQRQVEHLRRRFEDGGLKNYL
jgi:RNA polymerase sigma factor (sigma-70 family)